MAKKKDSKITYKKIVKAPERARIKFQKTDFLRRVEF